MDRRRFLVAASAACVAGGHTPRGRGAPMPVPPRAVSTHLTIGEAAPYRNQPLDKIRRRFDLYQQLGFGILRTGIGWWGLEQLAGQWEEPPALKRYFAQAISSGFRLKLSAGALTGPPDWFLHSHPDAAVRDAAGNTEKWLSPWYPGLYPVLAEKTDKIFLYLAQSGILAATDYMFVNLGYSDQPTYPRRTIGGAGCRRATPWFYDPHAQAAFAHAMQAKYSNLGRANRIWGTNFAAWPEVRPPAPGERPGPLWNDVLLWYRDSKRAVDRWQVANYRRALAAHAPAGHRPILLIMIAGSHIPQPEWEQVVRSGVPDCSLAIMSDSEFPMELAKATGCWLQYTGVENARETHYLRQYMQQHGIAVPMWGENAGVERVAQDPARLVDIVLENGLYGLDFINSSFLFDADGITPNAAFERLAAGSRRLRQALG